MNSVKETNQKNVYLEKRYIVRLVRLVFVMATSTVIACAMYYILIHFIWDISELDLPDYTQNIVICLLALLACMHGAREVFSCKLKSTKEQLTEMATVFKEEGADAANGFVDVALGGLETTAGALSGRTVEYIDEHGNYVG